MNEKIESLSAFLRSKEFIAALIISIFFAWVQAWAFALPVLMQYDIRGVYAIFICVLLVGFATKILRMSPHGQALLWAMLSTTLGLGWIAYHPFFGTAWVTNYIWTGDWFKPFTEAIPEWMGPMHLTYPDYALKMLTGGATVPWHAWSIPFIFYYFVGILIFLLQMSIATILRKQFIDIEKLTFPYAVAATQMIETFKPEAESVRMRQITLIGAVIGVLLYFGAIQGLIWKGAGWSWWNLWSANYVIPGLPNSAIKLLVVPHLIALNYLCPVEVLFSIVVFGFIWWDILPAIWFWAGQAPLFSTDPGWSPDWQYYESLKWPAMAAPFFYGGLLALGLVYLFLSKKSWSSSLRIFAARLSGKKEPEEAKGENYFIAWIGLIVSAVALMAIYSAVGWAPYVTPLIIFELILLFIAAIRLRGEFTPWPGIYWEIHGSSNGLFIPLIPTFPGGWGSAYNIRGMWFNGYVHGGLIQNAANGPSVGAIMEGYKLGSTYEIPKKFILVSVFISMTLAYLICMLTTIQVVYSRGINNMPWSWPGQGLDQLNIWFTTGTSSPGYGPSTYNFAPEGVPLERSFANFFAGAIIVIVLTVLRAVFPQIPLHPIGIIVATSQNMYWNYFMIVIAFILKFATMKIGGAKIYEKYCVPLAMGIVFGSFFTELITAWIGAFI